MKINEKQLNESIKKVLKEHFEIAELKKKAKENSSDVIDGIPVYAHCEYIPEEEKATTSQDVNRRLIWAFKNDSEDFTAREYKDAYNKAKWLFKTVLINTFWDDLPNLVLVPIPASTKEKTTKRWSELMDELCKECDIPNGLKHIKILKDADVPSHYGCRGKKSKPQIEIDKNFFKGKLVVLIDDLFTSGFSITWMKEQMENVNANIIMAICLAKTKERQ